MTQEEKVLHILMSNVSLQTVLERAQQLDVENWYVGSGGISQTVWNVQHGFDPAYGIRDYDLVYWDPDTSYEAEDNIIQKGQELFEDISIPVEIRNQARVHLWYEKHFGYVIPPHISTEDAIDTWPTTSNAVGVRKEGNDFTVYSTFGLDDLLNMVIRPNKVKITKDIYQKKVERWHPIWPKLTIIPWEDA